MSSSNLKKRLIAIVSAMLIIVAGFGLGIFADELQLVDYGYHDDVELDVNVLQTKGESADQEGELDSSYNATTEKWFPHYTQDRDQGSLGICWAFSTANAADISYAKEMNDSSAVQQTSPGHLAYYFYNRAGDPLGLTNGDKNIVKTANATWGSLGGNHIFTFQAMANRDGLALESRYPYSQAYNNPPYTNGMGDLAYTAENIEIAELGSYSNKDAFYKAVKTMVKNYGAAAVSMYICKDSNYFNTTTKSQCYKGSDDGTNHAVTIVGWDDNYPVDKFVNKNKPNNPGAWIILNSWSRTGTYVNDGLFYLSYEDTVGISTRALAYDMKPCDNNEHLYQHDGTAALGEEYMNNGEQIASVFTAQKDMYVKSVGITEFTKGTANYDVNVYVGNAGDTIETLIAGGSKAQDKNAVTYTAGYHTFELDKAVPVLQGQKFCVVLTFKNSVYMGYEYSRNVESWIQFDAELQDGESYYRYSSTGAWNDAKSYSSKCYRLKAIGRDAYTVSFDTQTEDQPIPPQMVEAGTLATKPADPAPDEGYMFAGWYTDKDCAANYRFNFGTPINANITLYAKWVDNIIEISDVVPEPFSDTFTDGISSFKSAISDGFNQIQVDTDGNPVNISADNIKLFNITEPEGWNAQDGQFEILIPYERLFGKDNTNNSQNLNCVVNHMIEADGDPAYEVESIKCEKTDNGLLLTTSSFGPFAIGIINGALLGDLDNNGLIEEQDVASYNNALFSKTALTTNFKKIADVNTDNAYDVNDVIMLRLGRTVYKLNN